MGESGFKASRGIGPTFFYETASCAASFAAYKLHWIAKMLHASRENTKMMFEAIVEAALGGIITQSICFST